MASSLLESLTALAGPGVVNTVAARLGEPSEAVSRGLTASFGSILAGLASQAGAGGGGVLQQILNLIRGNANVMQAADNPAELANQFSGSENTAGNIQGTVFNTGQQLLSSVFGDKTGSVSNLIAQSSGMRQSSAASLLTFAAPLVLGVLGKRAGSGGLNISSLASILTSEKESLLKAAPAGIGNLAGFADTTRAAAGRLTDNVAASTGTISSNTVTAAAGSNSRWVWPALLVVALAVFWWTSCRDKNTSNMGENMSATADSLGQLGANAANSVTSAIGDAASRLGAFVERKLPDGTTLNVPEHGIESKLLAFITDPAQPVSDTVWFNFDRLTFKTGSATLHAESQEQLQNIANMLKAYPNMSVKIGGYTDNTGNATTNLRLSGERANTVMKGLVSLGIGKNRLAAEGYGDEHPVADNNTEEGRAQNRRIALRVTKK